jgi:hypothetical protein
MRSIRFIVVLPLIAWTFAQAAPSKQLPMSTAEKATENRAAADPTAAAAHALLQGAPINGRTGPAPFQKFTIPDPLEASATLPVRTAVSDVEAPVNANSGRPMPVLK